jgi:hypothetical protein
MSKGIAEMLEISSRTVWRDREKACLFLSAGPQSERG